jgi:class 3 adenylate cyclase
MLPVETGPAMRNTGEHLSQEGPERPIDGRSPAGERRQATVLFADLVGFATFSERAGEEAAYALIRHMSELMTAEIHAHGGTVNSFTGDGIMALFGVPVALEDAPLRACRAALAIQQRIGADADEIEATCGLRAQLRIAINTGPMIIGEVGSGDSTGVTAIGDTVNLASRLLAFAQPGAVVLTGATHSLVQGLVDIRATSDHDVRGKRGPQRVYHLDGVRHGAAAFDRSLSRGVARPGQQAHEAAGPRGGVDEHAVLLLPHHRQRRGSHIERAGQIGVEDRVNALRRELGPMALAQIVAGVVDHDVEPAELIADRRRNRIDPPGVGHVGNLHPGGPAGRRDASGDALERLPGPPGEHNRCTGARERHGAGFADPAAGAGDPGDLSIQARHGSSSLDGSTGCRRLSGSGVFSGKPRLRRHVVQNSPGLAITAPSPSATLTATI